LVERVVEWACSGACVGGGAATGDGAMVVEDAAFELLAQSVADVVGTGECGVAFGAREQGRVGRSGVTVAVGGA
jgi:hypothetical protein